MPLSRKAVAHLQAGEVLVGTMIGVGMFGIPFAFAQAGFFVGMIYLVMLGLATITLQLMYAEVTLHTPGKHRLVGYMRRYFNQKWAMAAAFVFLGGSWGALIAYILIGGNFLGQLLMPFFGGTELRLSRGFWRRDFACAWRTASCLRRRDVFSRSVGGRNVGGNFARRI